MSTPSRGTASPRLVALHLPQFHPIPENDAWWGDGFTEWSWVRTARPLFPGHAQPREPADLGYYDLTASGVLEAQAALAERFGVDAFCFYHYWFAGRRLLERPVETMLQTGKPDFPFMLCWANENWTRAFDGGSRQTLIAQTYPAGDAREHARALAPYFSDPRYVTVDGRPVFLVYRAALLAEAHGYLDEWRDELARLGVADPYLVRVESFPEEDSDPATLGYDAAMEFAPRWRHLPQRSARTRGLGALARRGLLPRRFAQTVVDYDQVAEQQLAAAHRDHPCMPCVAPAWDNTPRRPQGGIVLSDSTPESYGRWLSTAIARARDDEL